MITIITGKPGVGKTALNTYFCEHTYQTERERLFKMTCEKIEALNETREKPLKLPSAPPIFTNYEVKFLIGYKKYYEPYYINPYYIGLQNDKLPTLYLPPYSRVFISEAQRYYNSRKSLTLPDWVSRWFEMHRHYGIEIYMDVQRGKLIDLNIRELCKRFIEVQSMELETNGGTWINRTRWHCREFSNMQDFDEYINGTGGTYKQTVYTYEGDIFKCYNSASCFSEFVPPEGANFQYLPYRSAGSDTPKDKTVEQFYTNGEPKAFRK